MNNDYPPCYFLALPDWKIDIDRVNQFVDDYANGKDTLLVFTVGGRFSMDGGPRRFPTEAVAKTMKEDRAGILSLKRGRGEDVESRLLAKWEPATGPCVVVKSSTFRSVGKFSKDYVSFKYSLADFSHRASMSSIGITKMLHPRINMLDVPEDKWAEKDKEKYLEDWKVLS
jgi:hypothetical protein